MTAIIFLVSFLSSIVGAICGIGGGVVIKPVLDMLQVGSAATINFLSGCTVLSMSAYSVGKMFRSGNKVETSTGTPLAIGAAVGGIVGKQMFSAISALFAQPDMVRGVQALCLGLITLATTVYTLKKAGIQTRQTKSPVACVVIGLLLGIMSSFLGIGGGPINLVVLSYFFGMDTKTAASNSLYVILFSQLASLIATFVTKSVPVFPVLGLILMIGGGIGGGIVGRKLNARMDNHAVDKLFIGLMIVIIIICVNNCIQAFF